MPRAPVQDDLITVRIQVGSAMMIPIGIFVLDLRDVARIELRDGLFPIVFIIDVKHEQVITVIACRRARLEQSLGSRVARKLQMEALAGMAKHNPVETIVILKLA